MAIAAWVFLLAACIERSNPFDPINGGAEAAAEIRKQDLPALTVLMDAGSPFTAFLKSEKERLALDSAANAAVERANAGVRDADLLVRSANAAVEAYNLVQTAVDSLRFMARYGSQDTLALYVLHADFAATRSALQDRARSVSRHMDSVNEIRFPLIVYGAVFIDSALRPFARDSAVFARMQADVDAANAAVRDGNAAVRAYNDARAADNQSVKDYNESIDFRKRTKDVDVIVRSDSLQATTFVAKAGDSLFLGPGTFNVDLRFTNSGTPDSPIVVRGYPGRTTIIRPSVIGGGSNNSLILTDERKFIRFESLVFRGGVEGNVKLEGKASNISFRNCLFDSSKGPGLEAYDSDMELTDCEVRANAGHGVRVAGGITPGKRMRFTNVLFVRNGGAGLEGTSQYLELRNCTLANNGTDGIQLISPAQKIDITNSVIAWNNRFGINRQAVVDNQELLSVAESILFRNGVNWGLDAMEAGRKEALIQANPIVDPGFIDTLSFNYNPKPGSFLDASEKLALPVVIGYRKAAP
jgi:hypothetical protein